MTCRIEKFYLGGSYNLPGAPGLGANLARRLVPVLERHLSARCVSRWMFSGHHEGQNDPEFKTGQAISVCDLLDLSKADAALLLMLTGTSRGAHVEMGAAFALDIPVFLYRPQGDGSAFDNLCSPFPESWHKLLYETIFDSELWYLDGVQEVIRPLFQPPTIMVEEERNQQERFKWAANKRADEAEAKLSITSELLHERYTAEYDGWNVEKRATWIARVQDFLGGAK